MKGNCILYKETKERYLWELQRKNELNNKISIPIGFISIMLGSLAYFLIICLSPLNLGYMNVFGFR